MSEPDLDQAADGLELLLPDDRIRVHGEKVFEIRWDKAGGFKVVHFDQGDWERTLRAWPAPIPM